MTSIRSLLVATDFSVDGNHAVRRAALLAHAQGARLHILHVLNGEGCKALRDWFSPTIDLDIKAAQARDAMRRMAVEIAGAYDVVPTAEAAVGAPFETLLRAAERADLVVMGHRGRKRFGGLRVGGTADRMIRLSRRPVLVVRTPAELPYRRILVPIDFTASSDEAVRLAAQIRHEAGVQIFHAIDSRRDAMLRNADVPEHVIDEARLMDEADTRARMHRRVAGLGLDPTRLSFAAGHGPAVGSTLRHAQRHGVDLLVVGKQDRSTLGGFLLGNVSRRLVSQVGCDILVVPRPLDRSQRRSAEAVMSSARLDAPSAGVCVARSERGSPDRSSHLNWIHNTARFMPRRRS